MPTLSSPIMIERAESNYPGVDFRVADAADFELAEPVDAVFSNAVLHWVTASAQDIVAACVRRGLRPAADSSRSWAAKATSAPSWRRSQGP